MLISLDSPEFSNTFSGLAPRVNLGPGTTFPVYVMYKGNYRGAWADYKTSVELIRKRLSATLSKSQTFCFAWSLTEVYYTLTHEQSFGEIVRLYGNAELRKVLLYHFGSWEYVIIGRTLREKISMQPDPLPLAPNELATTQAAMSPQIKPIASSQGSTDRSPQVTPPSQRTLPPSQPAALSPPVSPFTHTSGLSFMESPLRSAPSPTPTTSSTSASGSPSKRPLAALFDRSQSFISRTRSSTGQHRWGASIPSLGGRETAQIIEYAISTHVAEAMAVIQQSGRRFGLQYEVEVIDALMAQLALHRSDIKKPELEGAAEEAEETIHGDEEDNGDEGLYDTGEIELGRAGPGPSTRVRRNY
ncbi:hypothetical protein RSOLAG22IIIB_02911 [Rhizoctonia solani]|uniref:Uncharacterized protein n=1 Tax=Rhizoctonia solani TaxID=456999 RepID=A0A0K6FLG7_9AGAM|nr:hypothetical protein RSOLAG22IIIB_02911 [Rhizoctonia solani]